MKQNKPGYFGFFILAMSFYLRWESLKIIKQKGEKKEKRKRDTQWSISCSNERNKSAASQIYEPWEILAEVNREILPLNTPLSPANP